MKSKPAIAGVVFMLVVLGVIVYTTMGLSQGSKVKVCMQFNGRSNCGTASGETREFALRAATANACALISGGVGDTIACEHNTPVSVNWIK